MLAMTVVFVISIKQIANQIFETYLQFTKIKLRFVKKIYVIFLKIKPGLLFFSNRVLFYFLRMLKGVKAYRNVMRDHIKSTGRKRSVFATHTLIYRV